MSEHSLTALSPVDGRYAAKADALRPIFSEFGLIRARLTVEVEWLIALAAEPAIVELAAFNDAQIAWLRALARNFSLADAARVQDIERRSDEHTSELQSLMRPS